MIHYSTNSRVLGMVEGAAAAALGAVLCALVIYRMPQGGSVSLGGMVPVWIVSLRRGPAVGMVSGLALGLLNFLQNPQVYHPLQPVLDYALAYAALGIAGFFPCRPVTGALLSVLVRFSIHVLSGLLFFSSYLEMKGGSLVMASMAYNGTVMAPDAVVALVLFHCIGVKAPGLFTGWRADNEKQPSRQG